MKNSKMELFNIQNGNVNIKITSYYFKKKPDNQDFEVRDGCVFETELCQLESITLLLLHLLQVCASIFSLALPKLDMHFCGLES